MIKNNSGDYGGIDADKLAVTVNGPAGTGVQTDAYYDGFTGTAAAGWTAYGGTWGVNAGNYSVDRGPGYKALADGAAFANGTLKADISSAAGGYAGVVFRASYPGVGRYAFNGYFAGVDSSGKVILGKAGAGANTWTPIASAQIAPVSGWYHLEVKAEGSRIRVYIGVGTEPVIDVEDAAYTSGSAGVRADNTAARFDNFRVLIGL
ncbi:Levanase precursor [compost metagenome]